MGHALLLYFFSVTETGVCTGELQLVSRRNFRGVPARGQRRCGPGAATDGRTNRRTAPATGDGANRGADARTDADFLGILALRGFAS